MPTEIVKKMCVLSNPESLVVTSGHTVLGRIGGQALCGRQESCDCSTVSDIDTDQGGPTRGRHQLCGKTLCLPSLGYGFVVCHWAVIIMAPP